MYDKKAAVEAILFANSSPAEPDKIAQAIEMKPSQPLLSSEITKVQACGNLYNQNIFRLALQKSLK